MTCACANTAEEEKKPVSQEVEEQEETVSGPRVPTYVEIRPYQSEAIESWENSGYVGIFDMATGTGKTTLLNNLLKILDIHKRVITVEDTRELNVPQPNRVHIVLSRTEQTNSMDYSKVISVMKYIKGLMGNGGNK